MSALPEWPPANDGPHKYIVQLEHTHRMLDAALARLRAISNRGYLQHLDSCPSSIVEVTLGNGGPCTCEFDELERDLLPPGEGRC